MRFMKAVQTISAITRIAEPTSESPYKIPKNGMRYIKAYKVFSRERPLRTYIKSLTEQKEKKDICEEIRHGYKKGEI